MNLLEITRTSPSFIENRFFSKDSLMVSNNSGIIYAFLLFLIFVEVRAAAATTLHQLVPDPAHALLFQYGPYAGRNNFAMAIKRKATYLKRTIVDLTKQLNMNPTIPNHGALRRTTLDQTTTDCECASAAACPSTGSNPMPVRAMPAVGRNLP